MLFCAAWSITSGVINTVALTSTPPAAFAARESAAALTLSGRSAIVNTSVQPKAKYKASNVPPADPKNSSAACRRLDQPFLGKTFYTILRKGSLHKIFRHKKTSFRSTKRASTLSE
jgi:hypothetical protein